MKKENKTPKATKAPEKKPQEPSKELTPEEIMIEQLRQELADERIKTGALSRRCIQLGMEVDRMTGAEEKRAENSMFDIINRNSRRKEAQRMAEVCRRSQERKAAANYEKACKRNAYTLAASALIGFTALLFGIVGIIHSVLAAIVIGFSLVSFGWNLNTCVYLLGRLE